MTYKNSKEATKDIALSLDADYLVQGSIRKGGNKVRISAKLTDARDRLDTLEYYYNQDKIKKQLND